MIITQLEETIAAICDVLLFIDTQKKFNFDMRLVGNFTVSPESFGVYHDPCACLYGNFKKERTLHNNQNRLNVVEQLNSLSCCFEIGLLISDRKLVTHHEMMNRLPPSKTEPENLEMSPIGLMFFYLYDQLKESCNTKR
jgi:hypothetical protein